MLSENVLSNNMKTLMIAKNISQLRLSELSDVPQGRISDIISGNTKNPQIKTVIKLAAALGVSVDALVSDNEINSTKQAV